MKVDLFITNYRLWFEPKADLYDVDEVLMKFLTK